MKKHTNAADVLDLTTGLTYRQLNNAKKHKFKVGQLVELEGGARLFVAKQTRDCDGTPLYSLTCSSPKDYGFGNATKWVNGFNGDNLKSIGD